MAVVYIATNTVNGKSYIGQSWNYASRKRYHLNTKSSCHAFHSAIMKYGRDAFKWDILLDGITCQDDLDLAEEYLIWLFMTTAPLGYNIRSGGSGGGHFTEESRKKMSETKTGKKQTPECIAKRKESMRILWQDDEFRRKHREAIRSVSSTKEWRDKNDIKKRWESRKRNDPLWKEKLTSTIHRVVSTDEWKIKNRQVIKDRFDNENWKKSIENNCVPCMCVETGVVYRSQKDASISVGCFATSINRACNIPTRTAGGFHWVIVKK